MLVADCRHFLQIVELTGVHLARVGDEDYGAVNVFKGVPELRGINYTITRGYLRYRSSPDAERAKRFDGAGMNGAAGDDVNGRIARQAVDRGIEAEAP
jgi:hypothetical protein